MQHEHGHSTESKTFLGRAKNLLMRKLADRRFVAISSITVGVAVAATGTIEHDRILSALGGLITIFGISRLGSGHHH